MNKQKKEFKYSGIKKYLVGMISSGQYSSGACIESENELCARFKLSRNTVRQAIRQLEAEGYLYRLQGKGTFVKETNPNDLRKVALVIYDTAYMVHPVTANLIRGIDDVLAANHYVLDVLASKRDYRKESPARFWQNYAGFLIGAYQIDELLMREFITSSRPCLWVKNYTAATQKQAVRIDFERAGFLAAEHLIKNSRNDLGLINFGEDVAISHDFSEGVKKAALEYGARVRARNIAAVPYGQTELISAALSKFDHPDGILCFSDEFAATVCALLQAKNIRVPEDVAVVGCNNTSAGEWCNPPITTIDIPAFRLGQIAAEALLKVIRGEKYIPQLLEPELIIRESSVTIERKKEGV